MQLLHFTPAKNLESILKNGFKADWRDRPSHEGEAPSYPGRIYLLDPEWEGGSRVDAWSQWYAPDVAAIAVNISKDELVADEDALTFGLPTPKELEREHNWSPEDVTLLKTVLDYKVPVKQRIVALDELAKTGLDGPWSLESHGTAAVVGDIPKSRIVAFYLPERLMSSVPGWKQGKKVDLAPDLDEKWTRYTKRSEKAPSYLKENVTGEILHDPCDIVRVNEPYPKHLKTIMASLRSQGWVGRPILAVISPEGKIHALTGSHRLAAACKLGIDVPVRIFDWQNYRGWSWSASNELAYKLWHIVGDDDKLLDALTKSGPTFAKKLMQQEVTSNKSGLEDFR